MVLGHGKVYKAIINFFAQPLDTNYHRWGDLGATIFPSRIALVVGDYLLNITYIYANLTQGVFHLSYKTEGQS